MTYQIFVTQEDIDKGVPYKSRQCPIALALNRVFPNIIFLVGAQEISQFYKNDLIFHVMSAEMKAFRSDFDRRKPVKPFSFSFTPKK